MNQTILVAEDDANDVALIRRAFTKARLPHQLRIVSSGLEVVDYLEGNAPYQDRHIFPLPGVLLLDLAMPRGSGFNVLRWIAGHPHFKDLPTVVLTGLDEHKKEVLAHGAKDCYVKPSSTADLVRILQKISESWLPADESKEIPDSKSQIAFPRPPR